MAGSILFRLLGPLNPLIWRGHTQSLTPPSARCQASRVCKVSFVCLPAWDCVALHQHSTASSTDLATNRSAARLHPASLCTHALFPIGSQWRICAGDPTIHTVSLAVLMPLGRSGHKRRRTTFADAPFQFGFLLPKAVNPPSFFTAHFPHSVERSALHSLPWIKTRSRTRTP